MSNKVYQGDIGTVIRLECGTDISAATAHSIKVRKPDGSQVSWTTSISGTTALQFTAVSGTLDLAGFYTLQSSVTTPAGSWLGESVRLQVYPSFS